MAHIPSLPASSVFNGVNIIVMCIGIISMALFIVTGKLFSMRWKYQRDLAPFVLAEKRHWLLGHLYLASDPVILIENIQKYITEINDAGQFWMGPFLCYLGVGNAETARIIMSTAEPKDDYSYNIIRPWIGDGLLLSAGKKWSRNRRLLTPAFHFETLRPYNHVFNNSSLILVKKWQELCGGEETSIEVCQQVSLFTLDSLLKCIFSIDSECQTKTSEHPYIKGVQNLTSLVFERVTTLPYHIDLIYHLTPSGWRWRRNCRVVHNYSTSVIKQRRQALSTGEYQKKEKERKYMDFVDILLSAKDEDGKGLSDSEIQDEVDTFMFEGYDTTSSAVSFMLYNMARHPEYQQKCREEIDGLFRSKEDEVINWDDLTRLPFLTLCIKESLRLHPPVPVIMRKVGQPLTFKDGRIAPKGTYFIVPIYGLHRNEHIWKDASEFKPDRFQAENCRDRSPYAFVPFSAGPRNCIGQNFAMQEMKILMAQIMRHFEISVDESVPVVEMFAIILRAKNGIRLHVKPRKLNITKTTYNTVNSVFYCNKMSDTNVKSLSSLALSDFTQTLGLTILIGAFVTIVASVWKLFQIKWKTERDLAPFILAKPRHWLLGHMYLAKDFKKILDQLSEMMTTVNDVGQVWFGPFHCYLGAGTPDAVKAVLSSTSPKDDFSYGLVKPWIGDGLLISSGNKWSRNRKLLTPGFHFEILKPYAKLFNESTAVLVKKWKRMCEGKEQVSMEMFKQISMLTLDSLLKCIFSVNTNCQTEKMRHPYLKGVVQLTYLVVQRVAFLPYHIDFIYHMSPSGWRWRRACRLVHNYSRDVIAQRVRDVKTGQYHRKDEQKYIDFVDILLGAKDEDGNGLTEKEIQDEVDTFMFEGHDTTASAISWMLYNMARHPEYQQRCRNEVDKLLDKKSVDEIEWEDLNKLPYLTMCLKESLRLHPPVPIINRKVDRQINLEDGRVIPPGTPVGVAIYGLHHNGNIWDDAEKYIPDRFTPGLTLDRSPHSFIPFSAGPRNCIGQNFAMNEMKITVAHILRNFHLSVDTSVEVIPVFAITLRAWEGIRLYVTPRETLNRQL
ncbi:uncharacterized protein [Amphiura filiformis]|uniref:uncharacterized protein n=1 Tax=Amphiura filiformis TaxID=82378 RepID=UPI003B21FDE9